MKDFFKLRTEEHGAGDTGTPSLVAKYKNGTPGQASAAPSRQPARKGDKLNAKDLPEAVEKNKGDPCWKGYVQLGMKKKGDKKVPNCVPEEVEQVDEVTQGKSYTQAQLHKKIQSGNWEATHDIKPGKHVEMRHHTGKRVMVHVKEEVEQVDELSQNTLRNYHGKSALDIRKKRDQLNKGTLSTADHKKAQKRVQGINRAANKMD